jgi:hypothetical protein
MSLLEFLVVLIGPILVHITKINLFSVQHGVHSWVIASSQRSLVPRGVHDRVYISRDVFFDESGFPFASTHPNVGAHIHNGILLLSSHLSCATSNNGDAHLDDYMALPIVPVVDDQNTTENNVTAGTPEEQQETG